MISIKYFKLQDNSDSSDSFKSPLKTQVNIVCNAMESYRVKSPIEKTEETEKEFGFSKLSQKNSDYVKTCVISESSDSEEDENNVRRCLRLNQYPNKAEIEDERKQVEQIHQYAKCSSEYFPSSSATLLEENRQKKIEFDDDNGIIPKSTKDEHLWTPEKNNTISNKKDAIISESNIDSLSSKYNGERSPRKNWGGVGPDIKLNLKDLGLNKQLGSWIEFIQQKPVMSAIPVSFTLQVDILYKMFKFEVLDISLSPFILFRLQKTSCLKDAKI